MEKLLPPANMEEIIDQIDNAVEEYARKHRGYNFTCSIDIEYKNYEIRVEMMYGQKIQKNGNT